MARSSESFSKKDKEKKRRKKKEEKARKAAERRANSEGGGLENMIAYVDEFGNIVDTPPDPTAKKKIKAENIEIGIPKREEESISRRTGILDFFNYDKGFGFIKELGSAERYFVHISGINSEDEILEGQKVTFDLERGMKGMNAVGVTKA